MKPCYKGVQKVLSIIPYYFGFAFFFSAFENKILGSRYDYFVFFKVNTRSYIPAAFRNPRESNTSGLHIYFLKDTQIGFGQKHIT